MNNRPLVALSLGGGGAKTFAHLGVIDAFKENNIPVDYLITCSAASVIGILAATGIPSQEIMREFGKKEKWLWIANGSIFKRILKKFIKRKELTNINQTKIPISIIVVDLKKGKEMTIEKGDPLLVPLGSSTYPGIWKPIKYKEYYLVDGGVLNPDPADVARKKVGSNGIVISVTLRMEFTEEKPGGRFSTILKCLYLSPFKYRDKIIKENSDIIISPVHHLRVNFRDWKETIFGYLKNNRMEEFYQKGYQSAKEEIPRIKELISKKNEKQDKKI